MSQGHREETAKLTHRDGGWGIKGEDDQSGIEDRNMYLLDATPFTLLISFDLYKNSVK